MQPLIDGDVLRYEIGFAAEAGWQQPGFPSFDYVAQLLHLKIANICAITNATQSPIIYLTGKNNFRNGIAKRTPYKDRPSNKPWHFKNLSAYLPAVFDVRMQDGLEADDLMAIEQTRRPGETIICTRDKDLFSVGGWVYSWELGNQPQFGPEKVHQPGYLRLSEDRKKLRGTGLLFFYSQCLTGDAVDSIPGVDRCGPVKAYEILKDCNSREEAESKVLEEYIRVYGDLGKIYMLEAGRLLHMTREQRGNQILLWNFIDAETNDWYDITTGEIEREPRV